MSSNLSRRELIAWLAAGAGAAVTGAGVVTGSHHSAAATTQARADSIAAPATTTATGERPDRQPSADPHDRLLVVIEQPGGNDGLSTVVPYGSGSYYDLRTATALAADDVLALDDAIGLHPNLGRLHRRGVTVVQGVGSAVPDGSHFEMQARWWTGDSSLSDPTTGWIGRLADVLSAESGRSTPATALSVATGAHPIMRSATGSTVSMPNAWVLAAAAGAERAEDPMRWAYQRALRRFADGDTLLQPVLNESLLFADRMTELRLDEDDASVLGYAGGLGDSLRFAAAVFHGGVGIRVIHVQASGDYDTHEGHAYKHPELMNELDVNLSAFHADLEARGLNDRVLVMTTSEFGRTLKENTNGGLDHGTASSMLLSGPGAGALVGEAPSLTRLDDDANLIATSRLEDYLGGVVEGWLHVPATEVFRNGGDPLELF